MRLLCLFFPRLGIQLVRANGTEVARSPIALVAGDGEGALVTVPSTCATAAGIEPGMTTGQARARAASLVFLPDNANSCIETLERVASILRTRATTDVALLSRDAICISLAGLERQFASEQHAATALSRLVRAWSGLDVRAGVAGTPEAALTAARSARRYPAICPADGAVAPLPALPPDLAARAAWENPADASLAARKLATLFQHLQPALDAYALSYRRVRLTVERPDRTETLTLDLPYPQHNTAGAAARIQAAAGQAGLAGAIAITVALGRIGPSVHIDRWQPAAPAVRAVAVSAMPGQRRLQLAS